MAAPGPWLTRACKPWTMGAGRAAVRLYWWWLRILPAIDAIIMECCDACSGRHHCMPRLLIHCRRAGLQFLLRRGKLEQRCQPPCTTHQ
eukprot:SAG31_NODE_1252_length_9108_cov_24.066711_4_plen_89_part_00